VRLLLAPVRGATHNDANSNSVKRRQVTSLTTPLQPFLGVEMMMMTAFPFGGWGLPSSFTKILSHSTSPPLDGQASPPRPPSLLSTFHARPGPVASLHRYPSCRLAFWGLALAAAQGVPSTEPPRKQRISQIAPLTRQRCKRVTCVVVVGGGRFGGDIAAIGAAVGGGGGGGFGR
jgi:hypothetical protein